ncbi:MAG: glucose-1-phosphate cytidylyltransferase [Flavobacteriaceae bacterium]|nr:glucose-1-phosphate cytidylyltransferase [Flavobacteriaceae bacterium]|tara:strand:- start:2167 stop:2865 length:699 start_codon:yes stop_codon:yes gene_type:complete
MKVVILAGGLGTRISEYTKSIPKPMIKVMGKPILLRIMDHYANYGHKEFYIATGFKSKIIENYFRKLKSKKYQINLINTGKNTMTGGRLKKLKKYLNETFLMSYGDGLSNVNINDLVKFHKKNKKLVTLTAVRPPARFGAIKISNNSVKYFREKNSLDEGWINGGFFVIEPKFINLIKDSNTYLEQEPFKKISKNKQLSAFKHHGFWQCMDTLRDKEILEKKIKNKEHLEKK